MSAADLGARVADLSARLAQLESTVARLETNGLPSGQNRTARALAALADRIDQSTPGRVPGYETQKLEAQGQPPAESIEAVDGYLACRRTRVAVE